MRQKKIRWRVTFLTATLIFNSLFTNTNVQHNRFIISSAIAMLTLVQILNQLSAEQSLQSETFHKLQSFDHGKCILSIRDGFFLTFVWWIFPIASDRTNHSFLYRVHLSFVIEAQRCYSCFYYYIFKLICPKCTLQWRNILKCPMMLDKSTLHVVHKHCTRTLFHCRTSQMS